MSYINIQGHKLYQDVNTYVKKIKKVKTINLIQGE